MKVLIFLASLLFLVHLSNQSYSAPRKQVQPIEITFKGPMKINLCGTCIDFAGQFINQLLNLVLNGVVVGGCGELCSALADKTGSKVAGEVCEVLCVVVGIKEFIAIIEKADLDPIYYCELLEACEIKDDGDATILTLNVTPTAVPKGSAFQITMSFKTVNGTGTGEISLDINTQDGIPLGQSHLVEPQLPGIYNVTWNVKAEPDSDCDPTQGPCEMWLPGNYSVETAVCNGQCGSKHPHSQIYDERSATFKVVDAN